MDERLPARTWGEIGLWLRVRGATLLGRTDHEVHGQTWVDVRARHDGEERTFRFRLRDPSSDDPLDLGGGAPSELLDPVDLVLFAAQVERELPHALDGLDRATLTGHLRDLELAAEAVHEATKFVPRKATRVPREALTTRAAGWLWHRDPERFSRARLTALGDRLRLRTMWYQAVLQHVVR